MGNFKKIECGIIDIDAITFIGNIEEGPYQTWRFHIEIAGGYKMLPILSTKQDAMAERLELLTAMGLQSL